MTCNHGIMWHRSDPKPEIASNGSLKNVIVWSCTVPDCKCRATLKPDVLRKPVA